MKCTNCNTKLEKGVTVCPQCGADNAQQKAEKDQEAKFAVAAGVNIAQLVVSIVAVLALLAALTIVLLKGFSIDWFAPKSTDKGNQPYVPNNSQTDVGTQQSDNFEPFDNGVSYTVPEADAVKATSNVVATMGDRKLTNGQLRIYYYLQCSEFINTNYNYLEAMGLDHTKPLDQQKCYYDEEITWQQFFIQEALSTWANYQAVALIARDSGYTPDAELQKTLDTLEEDMEAAVKEQGYANGDAWIQDIVGTGSTMEDYLEYCRVYYLGISFTDRDVSQDELEAYYAENEKDFTDSGVGKDSGPMVDVRHILVCPKGDEGAQTYTDAQWDACLKEAEKLLEQWKAGEATEESFAKMANTYSEDGGSKASGGLYTNVTSQTNFVEPFLNWCMDGSRKVGDTGIVKTDYGYHIMYLSSTRPAWQYYAEVAFLSEFTTGTMEQGREKYPMETTLENIKLAEISFI